MKYIIYSILFVFIFISCENEMPFDVKNNPPKLIVNAILTSGKSENDIRIALTGKNDVTYVENATISLFVNGELKEQLTEPYTNGNIEGLYKTNLQFMPKDIVKIEVEANNRDYYTCSEVIVPEPIDIDDIDFSIVDKGQVFKKYFRVRTAFEEKNQSVKYYRLIIEKEITLQDDENGAITYTINEPLIAKEDVVLSDGQPSSSDNDIIGAPTDNTYGVFDNSRIDGAYTMTASIPYYTWKPEWYGLKILSTNLRVRLQSISKMQYFYLKALNIYDSDNFEETISPPVKFPSNIEGGVGIFGVCIETDKKIPIENYIPFPEFNSITN